MGAKVIEQAIYEKIRASTDITGALGSVNQVQYMTAAQETSLPYIVISKVSDPHDPMYYDITLAGQARIQIDLFHGNKFTGAELNRKIWKEVQFFSGTQSTIDIDWIRVQNERVLVQEDQDCFHFITDILVEYEDPTT